MGFIQDRLRNSTVEQTVATDLLASAEDKKNQVAILKKMGFTNGEQVAYFKAEIDANPKLKTFFAGFDKEFANSPKYDAVLAKMGKQILADGSKIGFDTSKAEKANTGIIDKLAGDLNGKGTEITQQLRKNPDRFATRLDTYASGGMSIDEFVAEPVAAAAPASAPQASKTSSGASKPAKKHTSPAAAPVAAAVAAVPATPKPSTPVEAPVGAAVAAATAEEAPPQSAPAQTNSPADNDIAGDILGALASASNEDMKTKLGPDEVKGIAGGLATKAASLGVDSATTNGFKQKIQKDDKLSKSIATNLQNNPDFVRSLARMAKDNSPLSEPFKGKAVSEMNKLMANPELLANDAYVKDMQKKFEMAEQFKKFGLNEMLTKMLDGLRGQSYGLFEQVGDISAGFSGARSVVTMGNGGGFMGSVMFNMNNFNANVDEARSNANYSASSMTAFSVKGADGKYFHDVPVKDDKGNVLKKEDGTPLTRSVGNYTVNLKTANGKDVEVIPSVGVLVAKQASDGNYRVPVITGIDKNGAADKLSFVMLAPAEFERYKKIAEADAAKAGNSIREFEVSRLADAAPKQPSGMTVARVDPGTGAVTTSTTYPTAAPTQIAPPSNGREQAANERDFALQG